jgi:hypothetical protein
LSLSLETVASARGFGGFGGVSRHFGTSAAIARHYAAFGRWGRETGWSQSGWWPQGGWGLQYNGYIPLTAYSGNDVTGSISPVRFFLQAEPTNGLTCRHSQEVVMVPSEEGGTRPITVTRCF